MKKSIHKLTPEDFQIQPIWTPIDDLEDSDMEVKPLQGNEFHMEEIYLISSKFTFADGTEAEGYIRFSWGEPIAMAVAISSNEFFYFAIARKAETEEGHLKFAKKFDKTYDQVFPLEYQTKIKVNIHGGVY